MTRRVLRASLLFMVALLLAISIGGGLFMYRLSQGPVSIGFVKALVESAMSAGADQLGLRIGDGVIERDEDGTPRFRLRNVELVDSEGLVIARAPRAGVTLDLSSLLVGSIRPTQLDLIGPRVMLRRKLDGGLALGFGQNADAAAGADASQMDPEKAGLSLHGLFDHKFFAAGASSSLEALRISNASVQLYDERNDAVWYAPRASLLFRRVPYGYAFFANADMAGESKPWQAEIVASYVSATKNLTLEARVIDFVPSDLSDRVFALSQLARIRLPLSGTARFELNGEGTLTAADASLTAGKGVVGFSDHVAEPVNVDGGLLRLIYVPEDGAIEMADSELSIGGTQVALSGRLEQLRDDAGLLNALRIGFSARNMDDAAKEGFTRVDVRGVAWTREGRFDLEQLSLNAGTAGAEFTGQFTEGSESPGVKLNGTLKELPAWVLKRLWPPVIAPNSRRWVSSNITDGLITEGTVQVNVPPNALAATRKHIPLSDNMIGVRFEYANVTTGYFAALPPIRGASGEGLLKGNSLELSLRDGTVKVGSGAELKLQTASMLANALVTPGAPADFKFRATGPAGAALELLNAPPLKLADVAGLNPADASGNVVANVAISIPLMRNPPKGSVRISATATLADAGLKAAFGGINLEGGDVEITLAEQGSLKAQGFVKLNGAPAKVTWSREPGAQGRERIQMEADLSDDDRSRLGADTSGYIQGPVRVRLVADNPRAGLKGAQVRLDLARATLRVDALRWQRPPTPKTAATFEIDVSGPDRILVKNVLITGGGMNVKGSMAFGQDGRLISANFPNAVLDSDNRMSLSLRNQGNGLLATVKGATFDGRPLINSMFQRRVIPPGEMPVPITIRAEFDKVIANRGETLTNVTADVRTLGSFVQQLDMGGQLAADIRLSLSIKPNDNGYRDMTFNSPDAGSVLRAANLYSKIAGGTLEFSAELGNGNDAAIRRGRLIVRDFQVRNEAALAEIDAKGRVLSKARRGTDTLSFERLTIPFSADDEFVRIGDSLVRGRDLGATATGTIRKADGALDIGGTVIPAYALNSVLGKVPVLGEVLVGGKGQGVFGVTFGLRGTMQKPRTVINPVSAIAPGFLRGLFSMGGDGVNADGTPSGQ